MKRSRQTDDPTDHRRGGERDPEGEWPAGPHRPRRDLGQNFLRNRGAAERIVAALEPEKDEILLEIGPGHGALTEWLMQYDNPIQAMEIDQNLAERLRQKFPRVELVVGDAVELPLPERPFRAIGNLPYNVGTPILRRTVASPFLRRAVFMVQKEVADRLVADPGGKEYGYLTLYVRLFANARILLTLQPGSFHPRPKVRSAVVVLDPVPRDLRSSPDALLAVISAAFRMRRKTLLNTLTGVFGLSRGEIEQILLAQPLDPRTRAEQLSLEQFDGLAAAIESRVSDCSTDPGSPPRREERPGGSQSHSPR